MAICAAESSGFVAVVNPQPSDLSTCSFLLIQPGESASLAAVDAAAFSSFFGLGLSVVITTYLAARIVKVLVETFRG